LLSDNAQPAAAVIRSSRSEFFYIFNAPIQRPRDALSSAQQAHNEIARLLRASDWASRSAATACSATRLR
jgi:hypothetical protein